MGKQYSSASEEVIRKVAALREKHYRDLHGVTIGVLFVFGEEDEQVLKHGGYWAAAVTKIVGTKERAAGLEDALIVIDRFVYEGLSSEEKDALLDHELQHLERVLDGKTQRPTVDAIDRPRLAMRRHDRHFGWFDVIAERHGQASFEVQQAHKLAETGGQLYFEFEKDAAA